MAGQSTMEGFAKMMAVKTVVSGGIGKINEKLALTKDAKIEKMVKLRQSRKKKEQNEQIFQEEKQMAEDYRREKGNLIQAVSDAWRGTERINDVEDAHAEALKEQHQRQIAEGDAIVGLDIAGKKKANANRIAGNKTEQEWFWGNQKRQEMLDRKRLKDEESAYQDNIKWESDAVVKATEKASNSPTVSPQDAGQNSGGGGTSAGFGGEDIVSVIEDLYITTLDSNEILKKGLLIDQAIRENSTEHADLLIEGLGIHSPPFLEKLTDQGEGAPSFVPEIIGAESAPDINGSPDVSMETMLDGEPMPVQSDQFAELLDIEREELDFDRRREAREIKAARMALEDRRDAKTSKLKMGGRGGMKPDKKKKKKGGGLMDMLWKFGGKYLMGIAGLTGGWAAMKNMLGLSTKGDDAARAAKLAKGLGTNAKNVAGKIDEVGDLTKTTAKATKLGKVADGVTDIGTTAAKATKLGAVGDAVTDVSTTAAKSTKLGKVADGVTDVSSTLGKGVKATNIKTNIKPVVSKLEKIGDGIKNIPNATKDLVKGLRGAKVVPTTVGVGRGNNPRSIAKRFQKVTPPEGPSLVKKVVGGAKDIAVKTGNVAVNKLSSSNNKSLKAVSAGGKALAGSASETVKLVSTVIKKAATGASRVAKVLAPLDILSKMHQGQGLFESLGNMVLEVGNLAVGGADWVAEQGQQATGLGSGKGFMEGSGADFAFQEADMLGNKEKWQTSLLDQGINKGVAAWTGTEQVANKKVWTEEQEGLADAAEDSGAVDVGFGQGDIEDLEKLSLLDEKSLQALLDYQVWDDEDQKQITDLLNAKKMGITATYDDNGVFGSEKINYGDAVEGQTAEQKAYTASLDPAKRPDMKEYKPEGEGMFSGFTDTFTGAFSDIFSHFSPDPVKQTKMAETTTLMAENATTPGSIFTHDTHLEKTLWDIWTEEKTFLSSPVTEGDSTSDFSPQSKMFGNQPDLMSPVPVIDVSPTAPVMGATGGMVSSELLAQIVSQISTMEKEATVGNSGGNNTNVITNQTSNNPVQNIQAAASTAHAPAVLAGTNSMGVLDRG